MSDDQFTSVQGFAKSWNPRQKGSNKTKDRVELKADDKSWAHGYYMGSRTQKIENKDYTIHKMKVIAFGNPAHSEPITDTVNGDVREFFGTTVLNGILAEKIQPGQCIKVLWLGKQERKKTSGNPYDGWDVLLDNKRAPINVFANASVAHAEVEGKVVSEPVLEEEDDSLPF